MPDTISLPSGATEGRPPGLDDRWLVAGVCLFLAAIIWLVFGQTLGHEFVNFDDDDYVYKNLVVQKGLTWEGFRWALTFGGIGHWHPLTWLSHMLDCQLYGLQAGGHHLTNLLLHGAATILLFLVLRRMTGFLWRSAFVAAVFAIHPLRVESVAWVAERKDVLSAFFFMLTLGAYVQYVEKSKVQNPKVKVWYGLMLLSFTLGLLSKNMLVTAPFVLLLLDYWPLRRLEFSTLNSNISRAGPQASIILRLVAEKIPLLVLTAGSCVVTAMVPEKLTAGQLPVGLRLENAVIACVIYLWQMIHPTGLACLYPNPTSYFPLWQVAAALGLLLVISLAAWVFRRTHPYFVVGWLWYLGMMVPVIGIVQISSYAHADRYTYLPQIGLYLLLTWAAADLCAGWRYRRVVLGTGSTVILMALIFCARTQTAYWRNGESLWTHTLACTTNNFIGHNNLGHALIQKGDVDKAIGQYQTALQINPSYAIGFYNLGNAFYQKGKTDEAIACYQSAVQISPDFADAHNNLGNALLQKGDVDEAITQCQKALQISPDFAEAHINLGNALFQKGDIDEAMVHYQKALAIKPDNAEACNNLGNAALRKGGLDEAIAHYQKAIQIKPDYVEAHFNLALAFRKHGEIGEAIRQFQEVIRLKPDDVEAHFDLGVAFGIKGQTGEAISQFQETIRLKPDYAEAHNNLGTALGKQGQIDEAILQFQEAIRLKPDYAEARNNLARVLAMKNAAARSP